MFNITYLDVLNAYLVCRKRKKKDTRTIRI